MIVSTIPTHQPALPPCCGRRATSREPNRTDLLSANLVVSLRSLYHGVKKRKFTLRRRYVRNPRRELEQGKTPDMPIVDSFGDSRLQQDSDWLLHKIRTLLSRRIMRRSLVAIKLSRSCLYARCSDQRAEGLETPGAAEPASVDRLEPGLFGDESVRRALGTLDRHRNRIVLDVQRRSAIAATC
jgi:hypothetical protein